MLTNSAGANIDLGLSFKSLTRGIAKGAKGVVKKTVIAPTKFVAKRTLVDPTKMVAKSAYRTAKGTAATAGRLVRGDVTGAARAAAGVAVDPLKTGAQLTKHAGQTAYQASKAVTNLALAPLRSRLNTLKQRRARLLSWQRRRSQAPTVAEQAQARKDVKAMLSAKGPHGKMLSWLAGPDYSNDGFGVVGYDDAAIAAVATALTTSLIKIINDAAKSKFAPVDAAKAGAAAGGGVAAQAAVQALAPVAQRAQTYADEATTAAVTAQEVANETAVAAEEAATEAATAADAGALEGLGWWDGFRGVAEEANAPAAMSESTAQRIGSAAQRVLCDMPLAALRAIGGVQAVKVAGSLCQAMTVGDDASVRRTLPAAVQIASQAAALHTSDLLRSGSGFGGFGDAGPDALETWRRIRKARQGKKGRASSYQEALSAASPAELGMLTAFAGADPSALAYGLAGVTAQDLQAAATAADGSIWVLAPAAIAVVAGFWMALRG